MEGEGGGEGGDWKALEKKLVGSEVMEREDAGIILLIGVKNGWRA